MNGNINYRCRTNYTIILLFIICNGIIGIDFQGKNEYKNWCIKMSIEAYLLSYEEFKIDEARRIYKI